MVLSLMNHSLNAADTQHRELAPLARKAKSFAISSVSMACIISEKKVSLEFNKVNN